ncbi:MAG: hypothetical protein KatS3mg077_1220 [Candidatus Binatia bacterium]|nr:MAG: hypothetical protein KatS3mg077_1220 [Candidatus Binatia bacterium]
MHSMFALGDELTHVLGVNHGDQYAPIWERTQGCAPGHFGTLQSFCVECCGTPCDCPCYDHLRLHPREAGFIRARLGTALCVGTVRGDCRNAPDTDGDGIGDPCDNCPQGSNLRQRDSDGVVLNWRGRL